MAMEQSLFGPSAASVQDQLLQQDAAFGNNLTPQQVLLQPLVALLTASW